MKTIANIAQGKLALAKAVVDRAAAAKRKRDSAKIKRWLVKSLRTIATMVEDGEISEWSVETNFGIAPLYGSTEHVLAIGPNGRDELKMTFSHSMARFAKRMRRKELKARPRS
jgi:hypothetical protein